MSFEQLDRSIDADSDSDDELAEQAHMYRSMWWYHVGSLKLLTREITVATMKGKETSGPSSPTSPQAPDLAGLSLKSTPPPRPPAATKPNAPPPPKPPRPVANEPESEPDDDENDPFGDKNVVDTPAFEREEPRW